MDDLDYPVRSYIIHADSESDMTQWINDINVEIQPTTGRRVPAKDQVIVDDKAFEEVSMEMFVSIKAKWSHDELAATPKHMSYKQMSIILVDVLIKLPRFDQDLNVKCFIHYALNFEWNGWNGGWLLRSTVSKVVSGMVLHFGCHLLLLTRFCVCVCIHVCVCVCVDAMEGVYG